MTNLHLIILLELSTDVGNVVQDEPPVCEVNESNTSNSTPDRERGNPGEHHIHEQTMKLLDHSSYAKSLNNQHDQTLLLNLFQTQSTASLLSLIDVLECFIQWKLF